MLLIRRTAGFAVTCSLLLPGAAQAQDPARLDPDSPAGVEYQLPLDQARRDAAPDPGGGGGGAGGGPPGGGSAEPTPLFGAGITPDRAQSGGEAIADADVGERPGDERSGDRADRTAAGAGGPGARGRGAGEPAKSFRTAAAADGGASTALILGGIALAVVVLGGALGLALRRGLGSTSAP